MSFELSSLGKEFKKNLEGGGKNQKYGTTLMDDFNLDFALKLSNYTLLISLKCLK